MRAVRWPLALRPDPLALATGANGSLVAPQTPESANDGHSEGPWIIIGGRHRGEVGGYRPKLTPTSHVRRGVVVKQQHDGKAISQKTVGAKALEKSQRPHAIIAVNRSAIQLSRRLPPSVHIGVKAGLCVMRARNGNAGPGVS